MLTSEYAYVFNELHNTPSSPSGVAVVGATVGRTVFGGSMIMGGTGDITYPATWRAPSALATGCATTGDVSSRTGFDLITGNALSSVDIDAAIEVVRGTAIPGAMWRGGYVFNGMVLRYPRAIEPFSSATAEWIVVMTGGWLE